ncbi:50S ribosomal protein L5 [Candidatus Microgenomates bacterium]|nr:50S ribosomal protein L5 [Candidatus Microgenomates bacterium]
MPRLKEKYKKEIAPQMMADFGLKNILAVPRIQKITINVGIGKLAVKDTKMVEKATENITLISGQKPYVAKSKKSIAAFKLREGMPVGLAVTMRGNRMYEFLDRLVNVALPRVRDFRGLSLKSFDGQGNYSIGIKEHLVFPEVKLESLDAVHGLQVNITLNKKNREQGMALLKKFGFPFRK